MSNHVIVELQSIVYVKVPVENTDADMAIEEAYHKINEMSISTIKQEIIQNDGTVHMDHVDDWKIEDYHFVDEED